jgi:ArsR family transcriptional regulator
MADQSGSGPAEGREERAETGPDGSCCSTVTHGLSEHDAEIDVRTFSALANDTRYEVLRLLAAADGEVCACELVPQLDVNQSTTSRALGALYQADLVDRRKEGRWRYYTTTHRAEKLLTAVDTTREEVA